jgi:hypothetical protein
MSLEDLTKVASVLSPLLPIGMAALKQWLGVK